MTQLYQTWLKDGEASTVDEGVRAQIQQSGLLEAGGTATEKISAENIDLVYEGALKFGGKFSRKLADELESLGESEYSGLPVYTIGASDDGRNSGYYEVEQVDVSPSQPVNEDAFTYTVGLKFTGTREDVWTAVKTNSEDIQTGLATGSASLIGLPAEASKVRWFSEASGKEAATASSTVTGEFGSVDLYDPADTSITDSVLLYELPYADTGSVDVRVYDDRNLSKYYTVNGEDFSQWTHSYHTSYEYEGNPVVDNGLLRLRFDEANGVVDAYEWDASNTTWVNLLVAHSNFTLIDADFERIGPADVRAFVEFENTNDGSLRQAIISVQRGLTRAVAREPDNDTWTTAFEDYLGQYCGSYTTDLNPARSLKARGEVK